MHFFPCLFK